MKSSSEQVAQDVCQRDGHSIMESLCSASQFCHKCGMTLEEIRKVPVTVEPSPA